MAKRLKIKAQSGAWLTKLSSEHPYIILLGLLFGVIAAPGSCLSCFTAIRELRKPDEAVIAGVDRDPKVSMDLTGPRAR